VRDRFRGAGYDHPSATFNNGEAIASVLAEVMKGVVRSGVLWDVLRGGYQSRRPRGNRDFGSPGFPFPFPMPDGRDTRGGDWREPDTSGGWSPSDGGGSDDFRTGGEI